MLTRRAFLQRIGLGLGVVALVFGPGVGRIVRSGGSARRETLVSLYMDKPFVGHAEPLLSYEPRGVIRAAEPLMSLDETAVRMHRPWL